MNASKIPSEHFVQSQHVMGEMAHHARQAMTERAWWQNLILAVMAGAFITVGALFSLLLSAGVDAPGPSALLLGLGFSTGFFFVILSQAVLFTEVNVLVPARILDMTTHRFCLRLGIFWSLAIVGNLLGALGLGILINIAHPFDGQTLVELQHLSDKKMAFREGGGVLDWLRVVLSGMLANWLVGMAAFFALMGRTIIGKYIPVLLAVTLFVAANFQHSPANAGYFALIMPTGTGPGWQPAFLWNLLPAALGNIIGATLFVAVPFHYAFGSPSR
jgi:formate/nitrite transporter FocA (FNT family)